MFPQKTFVNIFRKMVSFLTSGVSELLVILHNKYTADYDK